MRLTTLNIRRKALLAGCCMSDLMARYWEYIEDGDTKKADCALNKALKLDALRKTLLRWSPQIEDPKYVTVTYTINSGNYSFPFSMSQFTVDGINVIDPVYVHSGNNLEVWEDSIASINGFVSPNDDVVQVSAELLSESPVSGKLTVVYDSDLSPVSLMGSGLTGGVTATITVSTEADYEYPSSSITNAQMLSVIKKIDEICGCNC